MANNLAAKLRLPGNFKDMQWQVLAGPVLILMILSMMVLPFPPFILEPPFTFKLSFAVNILSVAKLSTRTLAIADIVLLD